MPVIPAETLRAFAADLLTAGGFGPGDAAATADLLVWADLRGVDSHGVLRIPRYIEMIETGLMVSGRAVETVRERGAVAVLDGGKCPGATGMNAAVEKAAALAAAQGIGWCAARNISHSGAIGYFADKLAARGLVGIATTASKPLMRYFGATGEALSTNPLAIAIPRAGAAPILLDMSTAAAALGKIMAAKDRGEPIPEGWAVDRGGAPTTDPAAVGALLPMAGAKGSGLSLMIEALTSVLPGAAVIAPALTGGGEGAFNGMVLAADPAFFGEPAAFLTETAALGAAIEALPPAPGVDRVRLPGGRGEETAARRAAKGVPVAPGTMKRLEALAARLGVAPPARPPGAAA